MNIQTLIADGEALFAKLQAFTAPGTPGAAIESTLIGVLTTANPVAGEVASGLIGLAAIGVKLAAQFDAINQQTAETAPDVMKQIVDSGVLSDEAVLASLARSGS